MSTEDDTFRKLRQVPYEQVNALHMTSIIDKLRARAGNPPVPPAKIDYEKLGWTQEEYINEWKRRNPKYQPK